jgi:flagellar biosynthesis chaperone FliJ
MKKIFTYSKLLKISIFLFATFISSGIMYAQTDLLKNLENDFIVLNDSVKTLKNRLAKVHVEFDKLNEGIYRLKTELLHSNNPLKKIELKNKLSKSSKIANQIKNIEVQIDKLNKETNKKRKKIISVLNHLINFEIKKFNSTDSSKLKISIIKEVINYENKKQYYHKLSNESVQRIDENPEININPNDNLDKINLKIDLIKDRLAFLKEERKYLQKKREELNSDLSVYVEMNDFMKDIRRNIDEEQEFYDRDRVEQIKLKIKKIKSELKKIEERLKTISVSDAYYKEKLIEFNKFKKNLLIH